MNIDLNIDNYDFNDLLKMFKIKDYNDKKKCDTILESKYEVVKEKMPKDIQNFYLKSKTILKTIICGNFESETIWATCSFQLLLQFLTNKISIELLFK